MLLAAFVVLVGLLLAYANGANDNFKGVATLFGSGTASYRPALFWATAATALGSVCALFLAGGLLAAFSGKGLIPDAVMRDARFPAAVALAAGLTVLLATRLGFPVSTTHGLIGALVGVGLSASESGIDGGRLLSGFLLPLLSSPLLAVVLVAAVYPPLRRLRRRLGVRRESCLCVGREVLAALPLSTGRAVPSVFATATPRFVAGAAAECRVRYRGRLFGVSARAVLDAAHFVSAGAVSFARGLNDTPKIAALLLLAPAVTPALGVLGVGLLMAAGGLIAARRVAETMSLRVTGMNPGQGFAANLVTSALVIGASRLGLPVSTTHVSCASLFGIGATTGRARWGTIGRILLAWVVTLPLAGTLGVLLAALLGLAY